MQGIVDRLMHWKSSAAGIALGGAVMTIGSSLGCSAPSDWRLWAMSLAPTLLGLFSKG